MRHLAYRVYIDESGDQRYNNVDRLDRRYLALTGVVVHQDYYREHLQPNLERLKRKHFTYDPDDPVILTRSHILKRQRWFGVLANPARKSAWDKDILSFVHDLPAQVFTVVIDKLTHFKSFTGSAWDPYDYSLAVLLNGIRGFLSVKGDQADIIAESRGKREDRQLQQAYLAMLRYGSGAATGSDYRAAYPTGAIKIIRKSQNIAGLQLADILCAGQKQRIVLEAGRPLFRPPSQFTLDLNAAADHMVNVYGHYLLD